MHNSISRDLTISRDLIFSTPSTKSTLFTNKQAFAAYKGNLQYCAVYYLQRKLLGLCTIKSFFMAQSSAILKQLIHN